MKTLLLMRHAKSSWKKSRRDHDRPLSRRGKQDAPRMGELLMREHLVPDVVLSSTARRARKTASKVAKAAGFSGDILLVDGLYPGDDDAFLHTLSGVDDRAEIVLLVGHNPALEQFLGALCGEAEFLPTSALAHLKLRIESWADFNSTTEADLLGVWRVKNLDEKTSTQPAARC